MTERLEALRTLVEARRSLPPARELRKIREAAGVSQRELARAIEVSPQAVANWESGVYRPRPEQLERLLAALEILAGPS